MTVERAKQLIRLSKWQSGMCLNVGNPRPDVAEMTDDERRMLTMIGESHGSSTMFGTLCEIANGRIMVHMLAKSLKHQLDKSHNGLGIS